MVDSTTQTALEGQILNWRLLLYVDIEGDVLRATTGVYSKTVSSSGDSELDGEYFSIPSDLVELSPVQHNESGSNTLTVALNGILSGTEYVAIRNGNIVQERDGELVRVRGSQLLTVMGDPTKWQGRTARLWFYLVDEDENQVGSIIPYYTGFCDGLQVAGAADQQKIMLTIENYIVTLSVASKKTYGMQSEFDSGDNSAAATIAAANGLQGGVISGGAGGGGGGAGTETDMTRVRLR